MLNINNQTKSYPFLLFGFATSLGSFEISLS